MEDFFIIDIPIFVPEYDRNKRYGWSRHKNELWDLLRITTGGYCMYCYDSIWINGQRRGQIEHGIEKANSMEYLSDCVPNLGIACENCNGRYKKKEEVKRRLPGKSIENFERCACRKFDCKEPCEKYKNLRMEYMRAGKIIIQPFEAKLRKKGYPLRLQYDLLQCRYIPDKIHHNYDEEELEVIKSHIKLFELNSPERKNFEVGKYCKNVIDHQSLMQGIEYNNLIVDLFRKKLQNLNIEDAIKVCEIIYTNAFLKLAT